MGSPQDASRRSHLKTFFGTYAATSSGVGVGAQHNLVPSTLYQLSTEQQPSTPIPLIHHQGFYSRSHPTRSSPPVDVQAISRESLAYAVDAGTGLSNRGTPNSPLAANVASPALGAIGGEQGFIANTYYSPSFEFPLLSSPGTSVDTHSESDHAHAHHVTQAPRRSCPTLPTTFSPGSPNADPALHLLLKFIQASAFYLSHEEEPHIGTRKANEILQYVTDHGGDLRGRSLALGQSIYALFIDPQGSICMFCQAPKNNLQRGIECVRSHLDHRPYECGGELVGCLRCEGSLARARFRNIRVLKQHIEDQINKRTSNPAHSDPQMGSQAPNQNTSPQKSQQRARRATKK
ncbi:hypothetical protein CPB86DRAFT_595172 [Serendipita vermifera]|nr:hypothetical protein CPB86DRAFT_595172 [Serendipita vermifera]